MKNKSCNNPVCSVCGNKMVKNGKTSAKKTRWRCRACGASSIQHRQDITRKKQLRLFMKWLLENYSLKQLAIPSSSFYYQCDWCWRIPVPQPSRTGVIRAQIMVDGTYFQGWCLLVAYDSKHVLAWQWCNRESKASWKALLQRVTESTVVVTDGGTGLRSALSELWPHTRIQRCFFHIQQNVIRYTTQHPNLEAGKEILDFTNELMKVRTQQQAEQWKEQYDNWEQKWEDFLKERTFINPYPKKPRKRAWWYTHRDLRTVRALYRRIISDNSLFTFIEMKTDSPINRTTSPLEGGVNKGIKDLLRAHKGMSEEHARRAVEWYLNSLTEYPVDPWDEAVKFFKKETMNTPHEEKEEYITGYDNAINPVQPWEDSYLFIRKGWAGR